MSKFIKLLFLGIFLLPAAGHAQADSPEGTALQGAESASNLIMGTVVETMNAGGFTYVCLENNGQTIWALIRETPVAVGEEIEIANGSVRSNFTSDTLGRTFETIIFSRGMIRR
jgi:hypothetical protein